MAEPVRTSSDQCRTLRGRKFTRKRLFQLDWNNVNHFKSAGWWHRKGHWYHDARISQHCWEVSGRKSWFMLSSLKVYLNSMRNAWEMVSSMQSQAALGGQQTTTETRGEQWTDVLTVPVTFSHFDLFEFWDKTKNNVKIILFKLNVLSN